MERYKKYEGFKNFLDGFEILEFNVESRNKNNYIYLLKTIKFATFEYDWKTNHININIMRTKTLFTIALILA